MAYHPCDAIRRSGAGWLVAFYHWPLQDLVGMLLSTIFAAGSIVAMALLAIASFVIRRPLATW